ncbi:hypothetical protein Droror1_Dr00025082 [Drosera rotundifolia]
MLDCGFDVMQSLHNYDESSWIRVKLDRVMCNDLWLYEILNSKACFLEPYISDRSPMLVKLLDTPRAKRPFGHLNLWARHCSFRTLVMQASHTSFSGSNMFCLLKKLKYLVYQLRKLHYQRFLNLAASIGAQTKCLEHL